MYHGWPARLQLDGVRKAYMELAFVAGPGIPFDRGASIG